MIIEFQDSEYTLNEYEIKFVFPYLYRFGIKEKLDFLDTKSFLVRDEQILRLKIYADTIVKDFLSDCYEEPTSKELSKHSIRYTKMIYDNREYKLWASQRKPIDLLIYTFILISNRLQIAYDNKEKVKVLQIW